MKKKRWISLGLVLALCAAFCLPAFAMAAEAPESSTPKNEAVYANLNEDGTVSGIYVVNSFERPTDGEILDYGDYQSVRNMTTEDEISQQGDKITLHTDSDTLYYEGVLKSDQLPWNFQIQYFLDGKQADPADLGGAGGALEIHVKVDQNQAVDSTFYTNFALQLSMQLDTSLCSDIVADGATTVDVGTSKQLVYTILPGSGADFTVTANVHDFTMSNISITAMRMALDLDLPDSQEVSDPLTALEEGIVSLNSGSNQLDRGAAALTLGTNALENGAGELNSGMQLLSEQSGSLVSGSSEIQAALSQMNTALANIAIPMDQINLLVNGSAGAKQGIDGMVAGIAQLQAAIAGYKTQITQGGLDPDEILKQNQTAIAEATTAGNTELAKLLTANSALIAADKELIDSLNTGVNSLGKGGNALQTSYNKLNDAIAQMPLLMESMSAQLDALKQGISLLYQSYSMVNGGVSEYTNSYSQIASGYNSLYGGLVALQKGTAGLQSGTRSLATGTQAMQNQTAGMSETVAELLSNATNMLGDENYQPTSFVSSENTSVNNVQFIMKTPAIELAKTVQEEEKTQQQELSWWQKLLSLFGVEFE